MFYQLTHNESSSYINGGKSVAIAKTKMTSHPNKIQCCNLRDEHHYQVLAV